MTALKLLDGAMGSELIRRGEILPEHIWSAEANITNPALVLQIHRDYVEAGANYLTTNTFRTTPRAYRKTGLSIDEAKQKACHSLKAAVELAKTAAVDSTKILGSIAPLEDCYSPDFFPGTEIAIAEFAIIGNWLKEAGTDIILLETMNSISEVENGLQAVQGLKLPIWVSFLLKDKYHLWSGEYLTKVLEILNSYSIDCVLLNCNPLDRTEQAMEFLPKNWHGSWGIYPNLGIGEPSPNGRITEYEPMDKFVAVIDKAIEMGVVVIGACCGSSPEHIQKLYSLYHELPSRATSKGVGGQRQLKTND